MINLKKPKKLLFLVSEDRYFCSHRLNLSITALKAGFEVAVATRCSQDAQKIRDAGITVFPLHYFTRAGLNPLRQVQLLLELNKIYKAYQPDIVHHVAMKPVILGSLVAAWRKVPRVINALGGLGVLFTEGQNKYSLNFSLKKKILHALVCKILQRICLQRNCTLILQNTDDLATLKKEANINLNHVSIIQGSGVDVEAFPLTPFPKEPPIKIACVSRLLWDKGIGELIMAAKILQDNHVAAQILLYGTPDPENPSSISTKQLEEWQSSGLITWMGHCNNVARAYQECHIAILPSYREGLPKSLLEAASAGRPIITTDVPGCREVVSHAKTGLLVPVKNAPALAEALIELINNPTLRLLMGNAGRKRIETIFSDEIIHQQILSLYANPLVH